MDNPPGFVSVASHSPFLPSKVVHLRNVSPKIVEV